MRHVTQTSMSLNFVNEMQRCYRKDCILYDEAHLLRILAATSATRSCQARTCEKNVLAITTNVNGLVKLEFCSIKQHKISMLPLYSIHTCVNVTTRSAYILYDNLQNFRLVGTK